MATVASLLLTGCGMPMFNALNATGTQTHVNLSDGNFRIVKSIEGSSSATYVLGIGGLSQQSQQQNAVGNMLKNANLKPNQTITNVYVKTHVSTFLGLIVRVTYSATGQVVEFVGDSQTQPVVETNLNTATSEGNIAYTRLLQDTEVYLKTGEKVQLRTIAKEELDWSSSSDKIAKVSADGTVQALSKGAVIIIETTKDGAKSDTCTVYVE